MRAGMVFVLSLLLAATPTACLPAGNGNDGEDIVRGENFYRVTPDLFRARQPSKEMMRLYEAEGIRTVINLRNFNSDRDEVEGTSLVLVEIPVITWDLSVEEVVRVLQAIRDADKPVLVHCQHGADRTGLMVAMYRITEQGWTKEKAIDEMKNGGFGFHSIWFHIDDFIMQADIEAIKAALR